MNKIFSDKSNAECVSSLDPPINIVIGTAENFTMEKSFEDSPNEDVHLKEEVNDKECNDFEKCLNDIASPLRSSAHTNTTIMFKESGLTVNEVVTLVAGYCLRFDASINARKSLMDLLTICAGPTFKSLSISHYFSKTFDPPNDKIVYYYYCTNCYCEIHRSCKKQFVPVTKLCDQCN